MLAKVELIVMLLENTQKLIIIILGEFGVVYRGQLTRRDNNISTELVAVKTLKGGTNNNLTRLPVNDM